MIPVINAIVLMEKSRVPTRSVLIPMLNASQANTAKTVVNVERMVSVIGQGGLSYFISLMCLQPYCFLFDELN